MGWLGRFLTSSIGQKLLMGLTGLFLILFLAVHLIGNLQLLYDDGGRAFNEYASFMGHNPLIQSISIGNFFFIGLHAVIGLYLWVQNRKARGNKKYEVQNVRGVTANPGFAKNMWFLGIIVLVFIIIHLAQFWFKMKFMDVETMAGSDVKDLYILVKGVFTNLGFVVFYVLSMIVISFHLWHGFQSAFVTLGWNHKRFSGILRVVGKVYAIVVPAGFALIPIIFYFRHAT